MNSLEERAVSVRKELEREMNQRVEEKYPYKEAIDMAKSITRGERQRDYAHPLLNMVRIAVRQTITHRFDLLPERAINPFRATLAMVDVKLARQVATGKQDNIVDTLGYADMVDRMVRKLIEMGYCNTYEEAVCFFNEWTLPQLYTFMLELEEHFKQEARDAELPF